jgi:phosphonate transport system ATP-binding protein
MPASSTITLDRVTKRFAVKCALDGVAATILPGEFIAIIGSSGAGKTTLLRCLACATPVTEGAIRFGAQDLATLRGSALRRHRARVGMIYQQFNLSCMRTQTSSVPRTYTASPLGLTTPTRP